MAVPIFQKNRNKELIPDMVLITSDVQAPDGSDSYGIQPGIV
jgi:hypothetical protein